jgi:hypothetical protein
MWKKNNEGILLQINATVIAGIFIFASISSLQIIDKLDYTIPSSSILDYQRSQDSLEELALLKPEILDPLLNISSEYLNASLIKDYQQRIKYYNTLLQEDIAISQKEAENSQLYNQKMIEVNALRDTHLRYGIIIIMLVPFVFSSFIILIFHKYNAARKWTGYGFVVLIGTFVILWILISNSIDLKIKERDNILSQTVNS